MDFAIGKYFNTALAKEPLNWAIVFVIATIWLLAFHAVMQGFSAMQGKGGAIGAPPGTVNIQTSSTGVFSGPGTLATPSAIDGLSNYLGTGGGMWTDGGESKFPEDGWTGNH